MTILENQNNNQIKQDSVISLHEVIDRPDKHNRKLIIVVLLMIFLLVCTGVFAVYLLFTKSNPIANVVSDWKTYQVKKSYKRTNISFEIKYPPEFGEPEQKSEEIKWVDKNNKIKFSISWFNPDVMYDVESICMETLCNQVDEVAIIDQQNIVSIQKPTKKRQDQLNLSNGFLYAEIYNAKEAYNLTITTDVLPVADFKEILSTFRFLDTVSSQLGDASNKEECLQKGGVWQSWGRDYPQTYCQVPATDSGNACIDGAECAYDCVTSDTKSTSGTCSQYKKEFGCFSLINKGKAEPMICYD